MTTMAAAYASCLVVEDGLVLVCACVPICGLLVCFGRFFEAWGWSTISELLASIIFKARGATVKAVIQPAQARQQSTAASRSSITLFLSLLQIVLLAPPAEAAEEAGSSEEPQLRW